MREVMVHLLENAAKYSPKGSEIQISVEHNPQEIILSVADHGSGIDAVEQSLIFEKFYRGREHRLHVTRHGDGPGHMQGDCGSARRIALGSEPGRRQARFFRSIFRAAD